MRLPKPISALQAAVCLAAVLMFLALIPISAQDTPAPSPTFSSVPLKLTVQGTVISGTAGVSVPPGLQITLQIVHSDKKGAVSESVKRDTALGADSTFKFDNIVAAAGDIALVTTMFQDVLQGSPPIQLANDQKSLNIPLTLYGVTTDPSVITLLRVQHILDIKQNIVQVLATYDYKNSGDKLFVTQVKSDSGLPVSVHVPLPVGAQGVAFNQQSVFSIGGNVNQQVVQDSKPLVPGQNHEIIFSYQLSYSPGTPIDQDYPYNTISVEILIPDDTNIGISGLHLDTTPVSADQLEKVANTAINPKRSYTQYTLKTPMKAGDRLVYFLGNAPAAQAVKTAPPITNGVPNIGALVFLILVVILVLIAGAVAVMRLRRGQQR